MTKEAFRKEHKGLSPVIWKLLEKEIEKQKEIEQERQKRAERAQKESEEALARIHADVTEVLEAGSSHGGELDVDLVHPVCPDYHQASCCVIRGFITVFI